MSLEELARSLASLGIPHDVRPAGADGAMLLLPEYGRVLGIWPHWRAPNALWVNPEFLQALRTGIKDDRWNDPGGDRVWLAPAAEYLPQGAVPPTIDPGRYTLAPDRRVIRLVNRGEVYAHRSAVRVRFQLTRQLRILTEGEIDHACGPTWLRRAGWEEELELRLEGRERAPAQLWSIAEAPPGSECMTAPRRLLCVEDQEADRARLLLKTIREGTVAGAEPLSDANRDRAVELSLISPGLPPGRRGMSWWVSTYAFCGRSAEVRQLARRMLYST